MAAVAALLQGESVALANGLHPSLHERTDFCDFQAEWRAVQAAARCNFAPQECTRLGIQARAAREIIKAWHQLGGTGEPEKIFLENLTDVLPRALLRCYPSNLAVRNGTASNTARLCGGRGGSIDAASVAAHAQSPLFLPADITEIGGKRVETRLSRCTLIPQEIVDTRQVDAAVYDPARKRVLNIRRTLYRDLVLAEKETGDAAPDAAAPFLADQVVRGNLKLEQWDGHVLQWIHRLACLRNAMPELELPEFGEEDRLVAITMICEGAVCYKDIAARPVLPVLAEWLSPWQRECLNKYAPKAIKLTNGREVKLLYREDGTPTFGLKCQLLFGVPQTPRIAEGRVPCLVEILAPNQRPYQITADLASFWKNGYPQMKKDLAGRYPKHNWPTEAPL